MTIPLVNARLTAIAAPGNAEDYDTPATTGTNRWTGTLGIYVADELLQVESPGRVDEILRTRVEVPYQIGQLVLRGDSLVYQYEGTSHTRVAQNILHAPFVGRVRVTLQPA